MIEKNTATGTKAGNGPVPRESEDENAPARQEVEGTKRKGQEPQGPERGPTIH